MTGPLYCCTRIVKRTTDWRLKPLRGWATRSVVRSRCTKSKTLGSRSVSFRRACHCPVDVTPVRFRGLGSSIDVGAVNREAGDNLLQRPLQDVACEVGGSGVLLCD